MLRNHDRIGMMNRLIKNTFVAILFISACFSVMPVQTAVAGQCSNQSVLFPQWFDGLCKNGNTIMSPRELGGGGGGAQGTADYLSKWIGIIAANIAKMLLTVVGYVSLGFIIWGGFKYMINGDNSNGTVAARKTIQNAVIGLVISIAAIGIINFVTQAIVP